MWGSLGCILLAGVLLLAGAGTSRAAKGRVIAQARVLEGRVVEELREETEAARRRWAAIGGEAAASGSGEVDGGRLRVRLLAEPAGGVVQVEVLGS